MSLLSTLSGFRVKSAADRHQLVIELVNPTKKAPANEQTVGEEFLAPKRPPTALEITITFSQQAVPQISDVKVRYSLLAKTFKAVLN
jgi:hypothetical protein